MVRLLLSCMALLLPPFDLGIREEWSGVGSTRFLAGLGFG